MSQQRLNVALYRSRITLSLSSLLLVVYFVSYTWLVLPPPALFLGWKPDTILTVLQVVEEEYERYVSPGDIVLEVDGRPVRRGETIFYFPIKSSYNFMIQRGEVIFNQEVSIAPRSTVTQGWKLSLSILALAFWAIGALTALFARRHQVSAVMVGFSFQLIGAGIISPGPAQLGAPGGWIVGNVLIFCFPLIMLYLSFLPRSSPLTPSVLRWLWCSFYILVAFAGLAAFEVLFLFPNTSYQELTGLGTVTILAMLTGCSIVAAVVVLFTRLRRSHKPSYERRQLTILFSFFILAALPLLILVILPTGSAFFVPYPFVYSLFLFAPAGYFFVLHRHGYLVLDAVFGRIITIAMLLLAVGLAYAVGVFLLDEIFHIDFTGAWQGGLVLVLFGIAVVGQKPVQTIVDVLLYGREPLSSESLREAKSRLYANPEPATVADVISQIATHLKVQQVAVMVKHGELYRLLAGNVSDSVVTDSQHLQDVCLRNSDSGWLDDLPTWVELSIPITARNEMLGLFFLSRPMNDYFNAQQVTTLLDVADILAFGLLVISLVESMQTLSREALYEKELQRHRIATEIHNEPLHTLTLATLKLQQEDSNEVIQEAANAIRQVTKDLRRIISGLRPPALKESVEWMTLQVVREFEEAQDDIYIDLHLDIRSDVRASEPTKYAYYYVLIEALNNVSRHAEASEVRVTLYYGEDSLTLEVKDNGVGSDVATLPLTELLRGHHVGIADMYKWASVGGGRLEIGANEPGGTTVRLVLPLIAHSDDTPHLL